MPQGIVVSSARSQHEGVEVIEVKLDHGGGIPITGDHFQDAGGDSLPLPGDYVVTVEGDGAGNSDVVGYHDGKNHGMAAPGEDRRYSRKPDGTPAAHVWCKGDGTVVIEGLIGGGKIEIGTDGTIDLNGVKIDLQGNLSAPAEITAMATGPGVKLSTHLHPTGTGPSGPPQPGS